MTTLSQDCVKLRKRRSKTQQLTLNQRNGILQRLLQYRKGDKLQHGAINVVAADFQVSRITVSKIWHIAKRQYSAGQKFADVSSRKKKNCGRKRKDYSDNLAKMKDIPKNCCGSIRSLSAALDIPKSTLFDIFKRGNDFMYIYHQSLTLLTKPVFKVSLESLGKMQIFYSRQKNKKSNNYWTNIQTHPVNRH